MPRHLPLLLALAGCVPEDEPGPAGRRDAADVEPSDAGAERRRPRPDDRPLKPDGGDCREQGGPAGQCPALPQAPEQGSPCRLSSFALCSYNWQVRTDAGPPVYCLADCACDDACRWACETDCR